MLNESQQRRYLHRIESALRVATETARQYAPGTFQVCDNRGRHVVTEVDRRIGRLLRDHLVAADEAWLCEEDPDDHTRLSHRVVWVVDPLDGTREFVDGIPEWCISVGLVEAGVAVAGGTSNPATDELFLGALACGVTRNGQVVRVTERARLEGATVLASRSECSRGDWAQFDGGSFAVRPMGSVAYKLSLVAAGLADATWTVSPKHEWDVAAGVALVTAAGGRVTGLDRSPLHFNRTNTLISGLVAAGPSLWPLIAPHGSSQSGAV
jgi:myo-inositol-1(or 4)-monophosphatase